MGRRWRQKFFWAWTFLTIFVISYLLILAWREDRAVAGHALYKIRILRRLNSVAVIPHTVDKPKPNDQSNPLRWYLWNEPPICGSSVGLLRSHSRFPLSPTLSGGIDSLAVVNSQDDSYGQRIIGLLKPPFDGKYQFAIESTGSAELWLGENERKAKLIANIRADGDSSYQGWQRLFPWRKRQTESQPVSSYIHLLSHRKYYIEVLHVSGPKTGGFLKVGWRISTNKKSLFYVVSHPYLYSYSGNISRSNSIQYHKTADPYQFVVIKPRYDMRSDFYKYKILNDLYVGKAMPNCSCSRSRLVHGNVGYYGSVFHVREISVYPDDHTSLYNGRDFVRGNTLLDKSIAMLVVKRFMKSINKNRPYSLTLRDVISVERSQGSKYGDRFFLNLLLQESDYSPTYRVTTYVIQPAGQQSLCLPHGLQWRYGVHVTVIISVKNQGYWLKQFVDGMSRIYTVTKDANFDVVIVDFNSTDTDIASLLAKSSLKHYKIIQMKGPFSRTLGLQMGANSVANRHSIILLMDLHLYIPNNFIDNVRRRTMEGYTVFVPYFLRLNCNYSPDRPNGYWEDQSYGIVGIYKSDFDRIGGMNTKVYKYKWGGEDWELLSRILSNGLEVERFRYPQFFHYFHRRRGSFYKGTLHDSGTLMYYLNIIWQKFIFRRYGKEAY